MGLTMGSTDRHGRPRLIFPRLHGHRVKSPSPSLRTRRGNGSQVSNAGGLDYRTLRSIRKCPAGLLRGSDSADDARVPFSEHGRNFQPRHCPRSSRPTHARRQAVTGRHLAVPGGGVLKPTVRLMHHAARRSSVFHGHGERRRDQLLSQAAPHPPGNDPTRVEIELHRQIEPALGRPLNR